MITRRITEAETPEARRIGQIGFEFNTEMMALCGGDSVYYGAFEGSEMIAKVKSLDLLARFDGNLVPMSGIADVATLPQFRRRGAVREIFRDMLREQYVAGVPLSFLYPFNSAFYRQFGYEDSTPQLELTIPLSALPDGSIDGFTLYDPAQGAEGLEPFKAAYNKMPRWNLSLERSEPQFNCVTSADPSNKFKFAFALRDSGYVVFSKTYEGQTRIMNAAPWTNELVFDSLETLKTILAFAKTYGAYYDCIRFCVPKQLPVFKVIGNFSGVTQKITGDGMVRVVNPVAALKAARYIGSGAVTIGVRDDFLGFNHRLRVEFENGAATDVRETSETPDAEYNIGVFSQALAGQFTSEALSFIGETPLPQVLFEKPSFCANAF